MNSIILEIENDNNVCVVLVNGNMYLNVINWKIKKIYLTFAYVS